MSKGDTISTKQSDKNLHRCLFTALVVPESFALAILL